MLWNRVEWMDASHFDLLSSVRNLYLGQATRPMGTGGGACDSHSGHVGNPALHHTSHLILRGKTGPSCKVPSSIRINSGPVGTHLPRLATVHAVNGGAYANRRSTSGAAGAAQRASRHRIEQVSRIPASLLQLLAGHPAHVPGKLRDVCRSPLNEASEESLGARLPGVSLRTLQPERVTV